MIPEFFSQEFKQAFDDIEKNKPLLFSSISKVLEVSTSVAIRRSFLAMTRNYITCISAGAETQQILC